MLKIKNVRKDFGSFHAVDDVSFEVAKGDLLTMLGPSGCGKSTTLRCIGGLETLTSGEIWIEDELVSAPARGIEVPPEKRRIGMVFQSYALWPHMLVVDNVAYPLRSQGLSRREARKRAEAALNLVGLDSYAGAQPGNLSGGQQQRVALARALASECRVLLFDEPLSNLDVRLREQMRSEIRDLQKRLGITAVYVTHDQSEALAISDQIVVMNKGRLEQKGDPLDIYHRPSTSFVATFVGNVNLLPVTPCGPDGADFEAYGLPDGSKARVPAHRSSGRKDAKKLLGLRAELMKLGAAQPAGAVNAWSGRIERAVFFGDSIEYGVRWAGRELEVRVPPYVRFEPGQDVTVSIAPEDCFVVDADDAART